MTADFFGPVMPGQRIVPTAARANALAGAANKVRNPRGVPSGAGSRSGINLHSTVIYVSNDGEEPIEAGQPVTIKESAIVDPEEDRNEWRKCEFVDGGAKDVDDNRLTGLWGIALQLIEPGFAGPVLMSGITTAKVKKRRGEDRMVDMPCFRDPESEERALYTSAAGCAVILDIPELEDDEEGEAILHVLGYRTTEPATWAYLAEPLYNVGGTEEQSLKLASIMRCTPTGGLETGVQSRFTGQRKVEVRCFKADGKTIAGSVYIAPDPIAGCWMVLDSLSCPQPAPEE